MIYASVCSGIGGAEVAWRDLGWESKWVSEIDPFACAVLEARGIGPNVGDICDYTASRSDRSVEVLVGGTPCQSFSVAGFRRGLSDPRGGILLQYLRLAREMRPRWLVWENVPGVLSTDGGRAFGALLGALEELGYGWAYRTLDAQYFGLAQRRKRVFVVACLGDWRGPASVLLESEGLRGDPPASEEARTRIASGSRRGTTGGGGESVTPTDPAYALAAAKGERFGSGRQGQDTFVLARPLHAHHQRLGDGSEETFVCTNREIADPVTVKEQGTYTHEGKNNFRLRNVQAVFRVRRRTQSSGEFVSPSITRYNMDSRSPQSSEQTRMVEAVNLSGAGVRRLTPLECERLQGFPEGWTDIEYKGKPAKDSPRYKALGNAFPVPVVRWIGEGIQEVER